MSSFNLAKKLQPAKKAWKSFTNTLQSKLHKLKISKTIKKTTYRITALRTIRFLIPRKLRNRHRSRHRLHQRHQLPKSSPAIYVDELFPEPASMHAKHLHSLGEASKAKEIAASSSGANKAKAEATTMNMQKQQQHVPTVGIKVLDEKDLPRKSKAGETSTYTIADAWKAAVSSLPKVQGVDERAEEFISKFREEMKLQREQSILDFQERLARSA